MNITLTHCICNCQVNGNSLENVSHQEAVVFFQNAGTTVKLKVESGAEARIKVQICLIFSTLQSLSLYRVLHMYEISLIS